MLGIGGLGCELGRNQPASRLWRPEKLGSYVHDLGLLSDPARSHCLGRRFPGVRHPLKLMSAFHPLQPSI